MCIFHSFNAIIHQLQLIFYIESKVTNIDQYLALYNVLIKISNVVLGNLNIRNCKVWWDTPLYFHSFVFMGSTMFVLMTDQSSFFSPDRYSRLRVLISAVFSSLQQENDFGPGDELSVSSGWSFFVIGFRVVAFQQLWNIKIDARFSLSQSRL